MLELLVAFSLYRFDAHWLWWVFYAIVVAQKYDANN